MEEAGLVMEKAMDTLRHYSECLRCPETQGWATLEKTGAYLKVVTEAAVATVAD